MDAKKLAQLCRELAENKKAENVVVLDVRELSSVTDFFVIATGSSDPHLRAIEDEVIRGLRDEHGVKPRATEGARSGHWIVADFFDVIVHLMKPEVRERYDLESLWGDAPRVARPRTRKKVAKVAELSPEKA